MIHAVSGKPRNGKSMYAMRLVLDEILYGSRPILTNLPVKLGRLNEFLQERYPEQYKRRCELWPFSAERPAQISDIVWLLTDDEVQHFWTVRPGVDGVVRVHIPELTKAEWKEGKKPSYAGVVDRGVVYVIDECHNYFNSRCWAELGRDCMFYLSQHGHLSDTVIWVTQHVGNVDRQFRSVTQDFTYIRNLSKEKLGLFTLPHRFIRKTFPEPATSSSSAAEVGTFKLDVNGLASLYSTVAGVGIHDRGTADKGEHRKGIHWGVLAVGIPLIVAFLYLSVPKLIASMFDPVKHGAKRAVAAGERLAAPVQPPVVAAGALPQVPTNRVLAAVVTMRGFEVRSILRDGAVWPGQVIRVYLSDGRVFRKGDGHLTYLCEDFCVVDGLTNWYQPVDTWSAAAVGGAVPLPAVSGPEGSGDSSVVQIGAGQEHMQHPVLRSFRYGGYNVQ